MDRFHASLGFIEEREHTREAAAPGSIQQTLDHSSLNELLYYYYYFLKYIHFNPVRLIEQAVTDYTMEVRVHVDVTLKGILSC